MLETYPRDFNVDKDVLVGCIEACYDCAQACTACADDCLSEDNVAHLVKCIRLDADCADICIATGRVVSRQTEYDANVTRPIVEACAQACKTCGEECEHQAKSGMEHCRVCAEACRRCERACEDLLEAMSRLARTVGRPRGGGGGALHVVRGRCHFKLRVAGRVCAAPSRAFEHIPPHLLAHQLPRRRGLRRDGADRLGAARGMSDRLLPLSASAVRYRRDWLPTADWVELDDLGHAPQLDVPLEAAQLILQFTSR